MTQLSELSTIRQAEEEANASINKAREEMEKKVAQAKTRAKNDLEQAEELIQMDIAKITEEISQKVLADKEVAERELKKKIESIKDTSSKKKPQAQKFIIESL